MRNFFLYIVSAVLYLGFVFFIHPGLKSFFKVSNAPVVDHFFQFITAVTILMIVNLLSVYVIKVRLVGYTFLAWSLLKLMLVMGYFVYFIWGKKQVLSNNDLYEMVTIYFLYLFFEVIFGAMLLQKKNPAGSSAT